MSLVSKKKHKKSIFLGFRIPLVSFVGPRCEKITFFAYLTNSMVFCTQLCTKKADITFIIVIKLHLYVVPPQTRYGSIRVRRTIRFSLYFNKRLAPPRGDSIDRIP